MEKKARRNLSSTFNSVFGLRHDLANTKNQDRGSQSYKHVSQLPELKNKSLQMVLWKSHILFEPWADGDTYCTPGAVLPQWVAQLNQKIVLEVIINHGDKQPIRLQVSTGIDESFIKAHISQLLLFYKPLVSRYSNVSKSYFSFKTHSITISQISL